MANNNENKILNVPHLRFPEFTEEWKETKLGKIAEITKGSGISKDRLSEYGSPCILYGELYTKYKSEIINEVYSRTELDSSLLVKSKANDVIIPCSGETAIDISTARCVPFNNILLGGDLNIIRLKNNDGGFFAYQLNGTRKKDIARVAQGVSVVHLYGENLKHIRVYHPAIEEQKKITRLLSLIDKRIATQNKIIYKLKSLIRGIMVELQKRGLSNGTWKKVLLSNVLTERNELNKSLYPVYSVSVIQGIVNQMEYLGRSFAASDTSKYHVVHYGDLVYTKSPTGSFPYGIIKQSYNQNEVAVSPLYGVYEPKTFSTGVFLHEYFKSELNTLNYLHPLVQKGAKNTINIANQRFLESYVAIPSNANELLAISKLLCSLNTKLEFLQNILKQSQGQKQYLLRQMFI
ncbi:restriction endonuclease subunit S [Phocaeicola vulgatus]|uniref:restriction endonuclease subunit S n=1 Tax=Phocaeicola vulgatus TaxID=821 RepID=UPI00224AB450|nr:restriction endonuclease subunit S [Phocaeicola vulgatus]MCX2912857.1 restriction endonuclease subunit S [Phocaeicola vulgatus]MDB1082528.1 restriction endonuclease subunit S [Phocaeicola vulgatus]